MTVDVLGWVTRYADSGVPVVPLHWPTDGVCSCGRGDCESPGKHPMTRNGVHDATTDVPQLRAVWQRYPQANVGLATGVVFDALDIDHEDGIALLQLELAEGRPDYASRLGGLLLDDDPTVSVTASGWHVCYAPTGAGNRARMLPGVDWRGVGGYVVAPPSLHPDGVRYEWIGGRFGRFPAAPEPLAQLVTRTGPWAPRRSGPIAHDDLLALLDRQHGNGWNPSGLVSTMADAVEGERNSVLYWCARRLFDDYVQGAPRDAVHQAYADLHEAARAVGLGDVEIARTVASARRAVLAEGNHE